MSKNRTESRPTCWVLALPILAAVAVGCGPVDSGNDLGSEVSTKLSVSEDREAEAALDQIINDALIRYKPLEYEYDEGLLKVADQVDAHLTGKGSGPYPRFMPKLDEVEEREHFRESIMRWETKTKQNFREAIAPLIAEVSARKPGEPIPPDFHKRFGSVFDSFIPIEVLDARERQNRAIRAGAESYLAGHQDIRPEAVAKIRAMLDTQYPVSPATSSKSNP